MPLTRRALEVDCRGLAAGLDRALEAKHGQRVGFAIFLFDFGTGANLAYISNASRDSMIEAVEEWLARQRAGLESDPLGPRGEG